MGRCVRDDGKIRMLGVISDTHGLVRRDVRSVFRGVEAILHAGDVGGDQVLEALAALAPVTAVRGNTDTHGRAAGLPSVEQVIFEGLRIALVHDLSRFDPGCQEHPRLDVVIFGHSHRAEITWRDACLYLNPGAAGPRPFGRPATVALLAVGDSGRPRATIVELNED